MGDSAYSPSGTGTTLADLTPSAPAVADQESTVGATVNITLPVGTGGDAPLSYSASNLPAGLSFAPVTRVISGSPTTVQTRTVTYTVTDVDGDSRQTRRLTLRLPLRWLYPNGTIPGLTLNFRPLIEVSGTADLYADSDRGGTDTPLDGELGVGPDDTNLSRIRWISSNSRLVFNDNDSPTALALNTYFAAGGAGNDLTFYVTDFSGTYTFNIADNLQFSNASTLRFQNLPTALETIFDDITVGDRLIFSAARVAVTEHEVTVSTTRTGGTVTAAVTKTAPDSHEVTASLTRTGGTVTAAVTKIEPSVRPVAVAVTRTGGTVTAAVTKAEPSSPFPSQERVEPRRRCNKEQDRNKGRTVCPFSSCYFNSNRRNSNGRRNKDRTIQPRNSRFRHKNRRNSNDRRNKGRTICPFNSGHFNPDGRNGNGVHNKNNRRGRSTDCSFNNPNRWNGNGGGGRSASTFSVGQYGP